jgi:TolB-like protein/DNA-binding winged helix-turn-helix (wHTH) protein/tetratricopeptide (TPR) repeat protein
VPGTTRGLRLMPMPGLPETVRFGDFELDPGAYELRRHGRRVRIEQQPLDLLLLLVERRRQLVLRDDIVARLWGKDVFVDVETGVNTAIRKVRRALHDSPEAPTFVETVPGKGYRFIATVEVVGAPLQKSEPPLPEPPIFSGAPLPVLPPLPGPVGPAPPAPASAARPARRRLAAGVVVGALGIGLATWLMRPAGDDFRRGPLFLAVLPFATLGVDASREYVTEGLTEDMATSLGQIDPEQMVVVARSSTLRYKDSSKSAAEIGRELAADYVVEGSLRVEDSRLRVTATLVRVRDQVQVWSQYYDREPTSVLSLQRELSTAIAEQIRLRLSPGWMETLARRQTGSPDAYDLYLRGRNFESQRTPATTRQALAYYTRATELDPDYVLARAAIARLLGGSLFNSDASPADVVPRIREAVTRAVQADPDSSEAQYALAYLNYCCDWDWPAAEAGFRRALTLDPRAAITHVTLGHVLSQQGRHSEAVLSTGRAREIDPLSAIMPALSSQVAFQARAYPAALEHANQAIVLDPELWIGHQMRGQALERLGDDGAALEALTTAARFSNQNSKPLSLRAYIFAKLGRADEARGMLRTLESGAGTVYVPPYAMALINAGLDDRESALAWLERAYDVRDVHLVYLTVDPKWDPYRADPRFEAILVRAGFRRTASPVRSGP